MDHRARRAARELRGYLERRYGTQPALRIVQNPSLEGQTFIRLSCTGLTVPMPGDTGDDGQTYGGPAGAYTKQHMDLVAQIAERYVAIRSDRYLPGGGLASEDHAGMCEHMWVEFGELFPPGTVEVGVPWQELACAGASTMRFHGVLNGIVTLQLKSKFASLRWYMSGKNHVDGEMLDLIRSALETLSVVVCEHCGAPGLHRPGGWHIILCDACHEVREAERKAAKNKSKKGG
ncbi:hypothetical protein [Methylobacterium sp. 22177]|uniref:hypothetical protein n=1 Tax=Methylobacterium sp. 22177 TaxID=3453885 RepID=UPI003F84BE2F